jgi:hypothetical protein
MLLRLDAHDLELPRLARPTLLLVGDDELAPHNLLRGPPARGDTHARDKSGREERRSQRAPGPGFWVCGCGCGGAGSGERLAAAEELGADVLELAKLGLVAVCGLAEMFPV